MKIRKPFFIFLFCALIFHLVPAPSSRAQDSPAEFKSLFLIADLDTSGMFPLAYYSLVGDTLYWGNQYRATTYYGGPMDLAVDDADDEDTGDDDAALPGNGSEDEDESGVCAFL